MQSRPGSTGLDLVPQLVAAGGVVRLSGEDAALVLAWPDQDPPVGPRHAKHLARADSGRISGLEVNLYQPFSFLPAPFDGFGVDANVSFISSRVKVPLRPNDDLPFLRQPSRLSNVTLFFGKGGFSGSLAWGYADESVETIGADVLNDRYRVPRDQFDVLFRYRLTGNYAITAEVRNLTEEPEQRSTGVFNLLQYSRLLGRDFRIGLDFNF